MKNLSIYVTLGIFAIGIIAGWGKMQANAANNEKRVDKVEVKVEELKTKMDKQEVTQEYIKKHGKLNIFYLCEALNHDLLLRLLFFLLDY